MEKTSNKEKRLSIDSQKLELAMGLSCIKHYQTSISALESIMPTIKSL